MVDNKSFFDTHCHVHAYRKEPDFYRPLIAGFDKFPSPLRLLDLGCGDGSFMKGFLEQDINGYFLGIDISDSMLSTASKNLQQYDVSLVAADGFHLPLANDSLFDLIHLDSVLHHLVGRSRSESKQLSENLLQILDMKVSKEGFIVIEEMYYDSYLYSGFTAAAIFWGLKLLNFIRLDLGVISKFVILGLEVNFFSEKELIELFSKYGEVKVIKKRENKVSKLQRLFLQKHFGHISFRIRKR